MNYYDFDTSDYAMFGIGEAQQAMFSGSNKRIAEFKKGGAMVKAPNWIPGGQQPQVINPQPIYAPNTSSSAIVPRNYYNQTPPGVTPGDPVSSGFYSGKGKGRMEGTGGFANVKAFIRKTKKGGLSLVKGGLRKIKQGGGAALQAVKNNPKVAGGVAGAGAVGAAGYGAYRFATRKKRRRQMN